MKKQNIKLDIGTVYQKTDNGTYYFRYQINDKRKAISLKTKNKTVAIKEARKLIPLIKSSSTDVIAAHVKQAKGLSRKNERLEINSIWQVYSTHPERVRPKSKKVWKMYERYLQEFIDWLHENYPYIQYMDEVRDQDEYGNKLDRSVVFEYAEYMRGLELAVDTHNKKISRPATIFKTLSKYLSTPSPWHNKKLKRSPKEEVHTEHRKPFPSEKEQAMFDAVKAKSDFITPNKHEIEVLVYILKYTGQRQKDCVNLSWNKINMRRRRLWVQQEKTGKDVTIPMADELYEMLRKAEKWKVNEYVLPESALRYSKKAADGTDTGVNLINKQLLKLIKYVGLEPSVHIPGRKRKFTIYGVHSFRHGFASHCAEVGVPRAVCASILGADAEIIDNYYVHIGEEAQLKAIQAVSRSQSNDQIQDRVEEVLSYIDSLENKSEQTMKIEQMLRE